MAPWGTVVMPVREIDELLFQVVVPLSTSEPAPVMVPEEKVNSELTVAVVGGKVQGGILTVEHRRPGA